MDEKHVHEPVMLAEIGAILPLGPGAVLVDGTLGLGGHANYFLKQIEPGGTFLGFDWDAKMLAQARERLDGQYRAELHFINSGFRSAADMLIAMGLKANGILLDIGLNSAQVNDPERGMSFRNDGPLDMRMDQSQGLTASSWLNRATALEIENVLYNLGDERWAKVIAKAIVDRRSARPLKRTGDLVECVLQAIPKGAQDRRIHPATRTFQAVRLYVTGELEGLDLAIQSMAGQLAPDGVLAVLSYHSGEDKIVKQTMRQLATGPFEEVFRKPLLPSDAEVQRNPRSRSAKLRAVKRTR